MPLNSQRPTSQRPINSQSPISKTPKIQKMDFLSWASRGFGVFDWPLKLGVGSCLGVVKLGVGSSTKSSPPERSRAAQFLQRQRHRVIGQLRLEGLRIERRVDVDVGEAQRQIGG